MKPGGRGNTVAARPTLHVTRHKARPYCVIVVGGSKSGEWGKYAHEGAARAVALALRRHGLLAQVVDENGVVLDASVQA